MLDFIYDLVAYFVDRHERTDDEERKLSEKIRKSLSEKK